MEKQNQLDDSFHLPTIRYSLLFQISDAATKEYNLEKSMQMMVEEWSDMEFSIEPYGETGTYTLSSVDSIQVHKKSFKYGLMLLGARRHEDE